MALTQAEALQYISTQTSFEVNEIRALRTLIEDIYTRLDSAESSLTTLIDTNGLDGLKVGDLSAADANDTLESDANGVFQLNAV